MRRLHFWATLTWLVLGGAVSLLLVNSVPWVVFMSLYAIVVSHWSAYQASRAEDAIHTDREPG